MSDTIPTREALAGFIVTEPRLTTTAGGMYRLAARVGVEHWQSEPDGARSMADPSFHTLAIYGQLAARLAGEFHKGERFVAVGRTRGYPIDRVGVEDVRYEFVATRIGHDAADDALARSMSRHPASRARHLDTRHPLEPAEAPASGRRLRAVPDLPAQPTSVRHDRPLDGVGSPLGT
ncbi:hypothetical protein ET495_10170 [Xylanimonas allomyrinae]|uniref:Single-stranded DNA-binding protein n=1 Tax=Xylanimonas allomyrinae TaxID=2509459 RepID=A0A4P6EP66_9MICO|nr:single-stranded DNA-binding protein [Xylanimonas allomyrinae]QAY63553.1 hypothetical protein ET495_10170 [Xylanimonas allomyrinae]